MPVRTGPPPARWAEVTTATFLENKTDEKCENERSARSERGARRVRRTRRKKIAAVFTGGDAGESAGDVEEVGPWVPADEVVGRLEQLRSQQQQHGERL